MKERLIIISDLWGKQNSQWLAHYTNILETRFDVVFYDSCTLGNVLFDHNDQEQLHQQFIHGGIDYAVQSLIEKEKNPIHMLAFSVGGVIAWQYGYRTENIQSLFCISSTRLRKEVKRPSGNIKLYFGATDEYRPNQKWIADMAIEVKILPNKGHQVYRESIFAEALS